MGATEELMDAGKIRHIGVSNFSVLEMEEAQDALSRHKIASNQVLYHLGERDIEEDLLSYCQQRRITVIAYAARQRYRGQGDGRAGRLEHERQAD
jgi:diketogulonate reductase-like aldo/keto reductase